MCSRLEPAPEIDVGILKSPLRAGVDWCFGAFEAGFLYLLLVWLVLSNYSDAKQDINPV